MPKNLGLPLLEVTDRIAQLQPWEFFHDVDLIGVRDDTTGDLRVACILGRLQEVFGVLIHRHDAGRRYLYETVNHTALAFEEGLEDIDYLKVEWTNKQGLGLMVDPDTRIVGQQMSHGAEPVWHCAAQCLEKMFLTLAERPSSIQVERPLFADMLAPACSPLGIRIDVMNSLPAAEGAYLAVTKGIGEVEPW